MKGTLYSFLLILFFSNIVFSQNEDVQVGSNLYQRFQTPGAYFDYSDPEGLNIKISVWGFVKYPGKYVVPAYSTLNDVLSYAGGPIESSEMKKMTLVRTNADSSQTVINVNYQDILFDEKMIVPFKPVKMQAGDILIIPGEPPLYFTDYLSISLSVISTLISLSILILNIAK